MKVFLKKLIFGLVFLILYINTLQSQQKQFDFCELLYTKELVLKQQQIPAAMSCMHKIYLQGDSNKLAVILYKVMPNLTTDSFEMGMCYFYESWLFYSLRNIPESQKSVIELRRIIDKLPEGENKTILQLETLKIENNIEEISTNNKSIIGENAKRIFALTDRLSKNSNNQHYFKARSAYTLSTYYLGLKDTENAQYYRDVFMEQSSKISNPFLEVRRDKLMAIFKKEENNLPEAINFYEKAIQTALAKDIRYEIYNIAPVLSEAYEKIGKYDKSVAYSTKYIKMSDSIRKVNIATSVTMSAGKDKMVKSQKQQRNNYIYFGLAILALSFITAGVLYFKKRNKQSTKETLVQYRHVPSATNEEEIIKLIELSKINEEAFYNKFPDVYPDFYSRINNHNPQFTSTEKKFCMYLKLKFTTKEIAMYTNSTVKSIENKKYRLRKKLNIASDQDIYHSINHL